MANTGYKIVTYMDVNPQSPTFQETRTERVADSVNCGVESASWNVISEYCETDGSGNTGYYVVQELDTNPLSTTYGQQRTTRTYNTTDCPLPTTDPLWDEDETKAYCETMMYEPGHVEGNTGYMMKYYTDSNILSPTFGQSEWRRESSSGCPAPDTSPQIEEVSSSCIMVECNGVATTNGQKTVYGIDKNIYSPTYLSSTTTVETDTITCPDECVDCSAFNFVNLAPSAPPTYNTQHIATYTLNDNIGLTVVSKPDWIYKVTEWDITGGKRFTAHMSSNPMLEERVGEVAFMSNRGTCTFVATVTQSGATPCSAYSFTELETSYPASGDYKTIATYAASPNTLYLDYAPSWVDNISEGVSGNVNAIHCTVHRNYSDARQAALKFISDDQHCEFTVIISQAAGTGSVCEECNFVDNGITIPTSGGTHIGGYVAASVELTVDSKPNWITNVEYHMLAGRRTKSIDITAAANTSSARTGSITFSTTRGEETCTFTMNFTQESGATPSDTYVFNTSGLTYASLSTDSSAGYVVVDVTTTKNGSYQTFTTSNSCAWLFPELLQQGKLHIRKQENDSDSGRTCNMALIQDESNNMIYLTITQDAATPTPSDTYVFELTGGGTATTYSADTSGETTSFSFTSTKNGTYWDYSIREMTGQLTVTKGNGNITVVVPANTGSISHSYPIILTQTDSENLIVITINQDAATPTPTPYTYVFEFESVGGTAYTEAIDSSASEYSTNNIVSYKYNATDTAALNFSVVSTSNWLTATVVDDDVEWTADGNTSSSPRTGYIYLEQEESGNQIVIIVEQDAGMVN